MLQSSPKVYAKAALELLVEAPAGQKTQRLSEIAADLVSRYRRPFRERVLRLLAELENEARGLNPVTATVASEALAQKLKAILKDAPLIVKVDPSLKQGAILEQGEQRVDASLKGQLQRLKEALI